MPLLVRHEFGFLSFSLFSLVEGETSLFSFLSVGYSSPGIDSLTMAGGTDMDLTEPLRIAEVSLSPENTAEVRKYTEQSGQLLIAQA